jgi:putative hydrolase of the HAD superfamily
LIGDFLRDDPSEDDEKMIRAVLFDFGDTIALFHIDEKALNKDLFQLLHREGYQVSHDAFLGAMEMVRGERMMLYESHIELPAEQMYARVLLRLEIPPCRDLVEKLHLLYCQHFRYQVRPETEETLQKLRDKFKLGILSNSTSLAPAHILRETGLERYFDLILLSRDIGVRKPHPATFQYALQGLGVKAEEAVFIGDSLEHDVEGARRVGIRAIWVKNKDQALEGGVDDVIEDLSQLHSILRER